MRHWHQESQYLVLLAVADEAALIELRNRVEHQRLPYADFHEPDLDGALTALAITPGDTTSKLCANIPLLGAAMVE